MEIKILSMREALNDWLGLLQGPLKPPFDEQANFQGEWKRLLRLITLVMIMVVTVLTFSYLKLTSTEQGNILTAFVKDTASNARYTFFIILLGALFSALYTIIAAPLFKVKIKIPQTFFTFLFLLLPWIPMVVLVWVLGYILPDFPFQTHFIMLFLYVIFPIIIVFKLGQGIALVSGCSKKRCLASIGIPFVLFAVLTFFTALNWQPIDETEQAPHNKRPLADLN